MAQRLVLLIIWICDHFWNFIIGLLLAIIGYFSEIKETFHVLFAAFLIDILVGIIAAKRIRHERFSMNKLFVALGRMTIATTLVMLLFWRDKAMHQDTVNLANLISWIISGALIYSIAENGYELTGGTFFLSIKQLIRKKVQDNTGVDIEPTK